tara:strand:+ start:555 stop:785 length:231 start_codon:yes stop_codon:yes gene_type:complete
MNQNINQDIALAIFNSTDRPSQSRNIISLREKVEAYAKQRVIEELEGLYQGRMQSDEAMIIHASDVRERIHKLKQD